MLQLLSALDYKASHVTHLMTSDRKSQERQQLISEIMRPTELTDRWASHADLPLEILMAYLFLKPIMNMMKL